VKELPLIVLDQLALSFAYPDLNLMNRPPYSAQKTQTQ
jgi:hypothetical protein